MNVRTRWLALAAAASVALLIVTYWNMPPVTVAVDDTPDKRPTKKSKAGKLPTEPAKEEQRQDKEDEALPPAAKMPQELTTLESVNEFGTRLFKTLVQEREGKNTVLFPALTAQTTAVLGLGATGQTREELIDHTGFAGITKRNGEVHVLLKEAQDNKKLKVRSAASLWAKEGTKFKDLFVAQAEVLCEAEARTLPETDKPGAVNTWFKEKCEVDEVVSEPDFTNIVFLVASATTIEGKFVDPFPEADERRFTTESKKVVEVPFVRGKRKVGLADHGSWSGVAIPVLGDASLCIILPKYGQKLADTAKTIRTNDVVKLAKAKKAERLILIPKVGLRNTLDLKPAYRKLGLRTMFVNDERNPPFANMFDSSVGVSWLRQKGEFDIDEGGFRGKAAEAAGGNSRSVEQVETFIADRPYLAIVVNEDGLIITLAAVLDPSKN